MRSRRGSQEEKEALPGHDEPPHLLLVFAVYDLPRSAPLTHEGLLDQVPDRTVVVEAQAIRVLRQPQPFTEKERVEEEVVQPARITHYIDDRALGLEIADPLHGLVAEIEVREEPRSEPANDQTEARQHGGLRVAPVAIPATAVLIRIWPGGCLASPAATSSAVRSTLEIGAGTSGGASDLLLEAAGGGDEGSGGCAAMLRAGLPEGQRTGNAAHSRGGGEGGDRPEDSLCWAPTHERAAALAAALCGLTSVRNAPAL